MNSGERYNWNSRSCTYQASILNNWMWETVDNISNDE